MSYDNSETMVFQRLIETNEYEKIESWTYILYLAEKAEADGSTQTAEEFFKRALEFAEQQLTREATLHSLTHLAGCYERQGRYTEAQTALVRANRISPAERLN
jgi:tetratricopeptide (TPR) repeat protein